MSVDNKNTYVVELQKKYKMFYKNEKNGKYGTWLDTYKNFLSSVENIRCHLNKGGSICSYDKWEENIRFQDLNDFLDHILRVRVNGIASAGQSILSKDKFNFFIKDQDFLSALEAVLKKNSLENDDYVDFTKSWETVAQQYTRKTKKKYTKNPLLLNRVFTACTSDVSTTVDVKKFNVVFDFLVEKGIIDLSKYGNQKNSWFEKNKIIVECLRNTLSYEETIDSKCKINMFVWSLYEG